MEIILVQNVDKVGFADEIVTVKSGYARNYLIPQGLAKLATPSAKKDLAEKLKQRAHKEAKIKEELQVIATKVEAANVKVIAKVGENGKIFGSVSNVQVAEALKNAGVEVERRLISIKGDVIKEVGAYTATIKLHKEISAELKFEVVGE